MKLLALAALTLFALSAQAQTSVVGNATLVGTATVPGKAPVQTMTPLCSNFTANFYTTANCLTTTTAPATAGGQVIAVFNGSNPCASGTVGVGTVTLGSLTLTLDTNTNLVSNVCTYSAHVTSTIATGATFTNTCPTTNCNWNFAVYYTPQTIVSGAVEQGNSLTQGFGTAVSIPAAGAVTSTDVCVAVLQGSGTEMQAWSGGWNTLFINQTSSTAQFGVAWITASSGTPAATMTLLSSDNKPSAIACYKTI